MFKKEAVTRYLPYFTVFFCVLPIYKGTRAKTHGFSLGGVKQAINTVRFNRAGSVNTAEDEKSEIRVTPECPQERSVISIFYF